MLETLRMYGAAQDEALGQENKEEQVQFVNRVKQGNKEANRQWAYCCIQR